MSRPRRACPREARAPATFEQALSARTRRSGHVATVLAMTIFPLWTGFDRIFVPQRANPFLLARLAAVTMMALCALPTLWPSLGRRLTLAAVLAEVCMLQVCIAWMVPQVGRMVPAYLLGYTIAIYSTAVIIDWHWVWTLALNAFSGAALLGADLAGGRTMDREDAALAAFFLGSAAVISVFGQGLRYRVAQREFRALREAEEARAEAEAQRMRNLALLAEVQRLSREDPLTGVANRRVFDQSLRDAVQAADRQGLPVGLVMLDLDHFKQLNDTLGHQAGDDVLRVVGRCLREGGPRADLTARYGGEEFAVLISGASSSTLLTVAEDLRARIASACREAGRPVTASAGAAVLGVHARTAEELVAAADGALYAAKAAGRDAAVLAGAPPPAGAATPLVVAPPAAT